MQGEKVPHIMREPLCTTPFLKPLLLVLLLCVACTPRDPREVSTIFRLPAQDSLSQTVYDLDALQENGELIAVTLSGPDTYFEWRGQGFGLQYELVADFARSQGLRIRMEVAHDSTEMYQMLTKGEADVIALPCPPREGWLQCAIQDTLSHTPHGWITRAQSPQLAQAIQEWYDPQLPQRILTRHQQQFARRNRPASHHPRPRIRNAAQGIISDYDALFKSAAVTARWDWRLLSAQCYQESAFDPHAVSWAGAQGLMQIMPATAASLGVEGDVFVPATNVHAAARYIRLLDDQLSDIANREERIRFILASYNGGLGHVRDAMALAQKYGENPHQWSAVAKYILRLSEPQYYRDPLVRYGYLRGTETVGYVDGILSHWQYYRQAIK